VGDAEALAVLVAVETAGLIDLLGTLQKQEGTASKARSLLFSLNSATGPIPISERLANAHICQKT